MIQHITHLILCPSLLTVNLSSNKIHSLTGIHLAVGCLTTLILRKNEISSTKGLEKLYSLEVIDLSYNIIASFSALSSISNLPNLKNLLLTGNPIYFVPNYRREVMRVIKNLDFSKFMLDEILFSKDDRRDIAKDYRTKDGFLVPTQLKSPCSRKKKKPVLVFNRLYF